VSYVFVLLLQQALAMRRSEKGVPLEKQVKLSVANGRSDPRQRFAANDRLLTSMVLRAFSQALLHHHGDSAKR
jgi:hypothetical protein